MNNNEKIYIRAFSELTTAFLSHIISSYSGRQGLGGKWKGGEKEEVKEE